MARNRKDLFLRGVTRTVVFRSRALSTLMLFAVAQGGVFAQNQVLAQDEAAAPLVPVSFSAAGTAAPGPSIPDITSGPYVLAPTDQLDVSVQGHEDLHQTVTVLSDGTFQFPIAGQVRAAGQTVKQVEATIARGVSTICKDPVVTVVVKESHTQKISVAGAVKTPGLYEYHPGMRLLELVAMCGGPAQAPELTDATVVTGGGTKSVPVDLVGLMRGGDGSQNVTLAPGDMVLFSPKDPATSMIQVVGAVMKPGQYDTVAGGTTVLSMLTASGGATPDAALTQAQLMHAGTVRSVDLYPLKNDLRAPVGKILLVAGDTLLVPQNAQKIMVFGAVRAPAVYPIPDGEQLTLTRALAQAGGMTDDGDKKQVGILRLGPDNKRHLTAFNLEEMLKGDGKVADAPLQPDDILVVPTRRKGHGLGEYIAQVPSLFALTHF